MKVLTNLIFVIIIFVLATAFPLSTDIFSLNLSAPIVENPLETEPVPLLICDAQVTSLDGNILTIDLSTPHDETLLKQYSLLLKGSEGNVYDKTLLDFINVQTPISSNTSYVIDLSNWIADIASDIYTLSLETKDAALYKVKSSEMDPFEIVKFAYDFNYFGSGNTLPTGTTAYTLYFPDQSYSMLVPITRFVKTPENRWLTLYANLLKGPKTGLGLYESEAVVPPASNFVIANKIANIHWSSAQLADFSNRLDLARKSVAQTLLGLGYITSVDFLVDNNTNSNYANIDWSKSYLNENRLKAFFVYQNQSKNAFLLPIVLENTPLALDQQIEALWEALQFKSIARTEGLLQMIPPSLVLNQATINAGTLTLDFNSEFNVLYNDNPMVKKAFVESIVYTFSTVPGAENLRITVDNQIPSPVGEIDFSKNIKANVYINLEP